MFYKPLELPRLTARPVAVTSIAAGGSQFCVANEDGTLVLFDANQEILRKEQQNWEEMFGMHQHQGGILIKPSDRKSVVTGNSVSVRVDIGGRRLIKQKLVKTYYLYY